MEQFIVFIINHWILSSLFVVLLIAIMVYELYAKATSIPKISAQAAVILLNKEQAVVVDIRDNAAFKKGHIINSISINTKDLEKSLNKLSKYQQHPIIVVCEQGVQSNNTALLLRKHSFEKVHILDGGLKSWQEAGLPLEKE